MVTWHLIIKTVAAKCHCESYDVKQETGHCYLRNVDYCYKWSEVAWCCHWNLNTFVKICFNLFCYMTNHLITGPLGNSEFCFPLISMFPLTNIEILGKQNVVGFLQHFELESPSNCKVNSCDCTDEQWFCYKLLWWVLGLTFMKNHEY